MKILDVLKKIFLSTGINKTFLTFFPWLCACVLASYTFHYNFINSFQVLLAIIFMQLSIQMFDDYLDWVFGLTLKRKSLETIGVRGLFNKCEYAITDKTQPKLNFYSSIIFFVFSTLNLIGVCIRLENFFLMIIPIFIIFLGVINYHQVTKNFMNTIGTEILAALLCGPITFLTTYYSTSNHITFKAFFISLIFVFFAYYLCLTASFLNIKSDTLTQKTTLPTIIKNINVYFSIYMFIGFLPFLLIIFAIILNFLPKTSYLTFLILPFYIWHLYLMYLFEKEPSKKIKWNFFMGIDNKKIINEQNNISWYTVRYNFIRNIYITISLLLIISLTNIEELFIF